MNPRDRLLRLLDRLYAAPGSASGWSDFLSEVRQTFGGSAAHFFSYSLTPRQSSFGGSGAIGSTTLSPDLQAAYATDWARSDPWVDNPVTPTLPTGSVAVGEQLISTAVFRRTAFFNDFSRSMDAEHVVINITEREPHVVSALSINASGRRGPFGGEDVESLELLSPHVQRALQIHRRLLASADLSDGLTATFDLLPHGVFLLDAARRVVAANTAAAEMLRTRDGLSLHGGELRAVHPQDTAALRVLIGRCAATGAGDGIESGGLLTLRRRSGKRPLRAVVAPRLRRLDASLPSGFAAILFVTDPDRVPLPSDDELRVLFGLTPSEARLVRALVDGDTLARAADRLGVQVETVRKRLKDIFAKTDTHRQSELIRTVLQRPPVRSGR